MLFRSPVGEIERQLTSPIERVLWQIPDLEYLYSTSDADGSLLILRFKVGLSPDQALTRVRARLDEAVPMLPPGAQLASVAPRSIDDVPVLALTLTAPGRSDWDGSNLRRLTVFARNPVSSSSSLRACSRESGWSS